MSKLPFDERLKNLKEGLVKLCVENGIEITPAMSYTPQGAIAQIIFLDLDNKEVLEKYGLKKIDDKLVDNEDIPSENPLRN